MSEPKAAPALNPFAAENPLGSAIIQLVDAHSKSIAAQLRTIGLYRGQEMILKAISQFPTGCSQNQLATQLCLDHSSVTKSVTRMEKSGYVSRVKAANDRRITLVQLTTAGQDILQQAEVIWQQTETRATDGLSAHETQLFLKLARQISQNLINH